MQAESQSQKLNGILAALADGKSYYATAKAFATSPATVRAIAIKHGVDRPDQAAMQPATVARQSYSRAARIALSDRAFEVAETLLECIEDSRNLQMWCGAFASLVDKRRLEDGESTSRDELITADARQALRTRIVGLKEGQLRLVAEGNAPAAAESLPKGQPLKIEFEPQAAAVPTGPQAAAPSAPAAPSASASAPQQHQLNPPHGPNGEPAAGEPSQPERAERAGQPEPFSKAAVKERIEAIMRGAQRRP